VDGAEGNEMGDEGINGDTGGAVVGITVAVGAIGVGPGLLICDSST